MCTAGGARMALQTMLIHSYFICLGVVLKDNWCLGFRLVIKWRFVDRVREQMKSFMAVSEIK